MPYRICLETEVIESGEQYQISIPEGMHAYIFSTLSNRNIKLTSFGKFSDYSQDTVIKTDQLESLIKDLNGLIGFFYEDRKITEVLTKLKEIAQKAKRTQGKLFAHGD